MTGDRPYQDFISTVANNAALEEAAMVADNEAVRLDWLAVEMQQQINISPRRGLKWRMDEYKAGARAARRIAGSIRQMKVSEEER